MTIEKLSPTKLQVFISEEDMKEWEIKPEMLTYNSPEAQMLFNDVISQAKVQCGFVCDGANVVIEASPDANSGLKVMLTVVNGEEPPLELEPAMPQKAKMIILELTNPEDVVSACKQLLPIYHGKSHLFKYQNRFYIALQSGQIPYTNIYDLGEIVDNPDIFFGFLNEYADAVVRNDFLNAKAS